MDNHSQILESPKSNRYRLKPHEVDVIEEMRANDERRVLVIPDLHAPFIEPGFFEHCKAIYKKWNCNAVHMTGDLLDNSFSSFHEISPDGKSAGDELALAIKQIYMVQVAQAEMELSIEL